MDRDQEIRAILDRGRATRQPTPRWLWRTAAIVGGICTLGFMVMMIMMLHDPAPAVHPAPPTAPAIAPGSGLGIGLVIGGGVGLVIGFSIARQRRDHSSRNSP